MRRSLLLRVVLLGTIAAAAGATWRLLTTPLARVQLPAVRAPSAAGVAPAPAPTNGDSLRRAGEAGAPFRVLRHPAAAAYDVARPVPVGQAAAPPPPPRPALVLTGIVWSREPEAILEGIPAADGPQVVRAGQKINGLEVRRIARERVIVTGFDTTWTLKVRTPWQ